MAGRSLFPIVELLAVFLLVFLLQTLTALVQTLIPIVGLVEGLFVLSPPVSENPWTIVTSVYAHASVNHLLSNAVALILFGLPVAYATTRLRFHLFFVTSGVLAGIAQITLSPTAGVLGASGGVFALLGYVLAGNRLSSALGKTLNVPVWLTLILFVAVAAVVTVATGSPGVALVAHFVGLLVGLVAGYVGLLDTRSPPQEAPSARA